MNSHSVSAGGQQKVSHFEVELPAGPAVFTMRMATPTHASEGNSLLMFGVPAKQWARTLRRWGVPFVKAGRVHTARISEVEAAILRLEKRPARTATPLAKNDPASGPRSTDDQVKAALARVRGVA